MMSNVASKHVGELAIKVLLTLGLTFGLSLVLPTSPAVATTGDDVAAAQQKVTAAQQKLAAAQAEVDRLSQLPQKDAWDFYASLPNGMGEEALTVLNQNNKKGSTHRGDAKDSTSLDNMWQAVQWLERCNAIRSKDGLAALKVNITMMAVAQVNTNYSTNFKNGHSKQFNVAENLAWNWGNKDPFDGWYYREKQVYEWEQAGLTLEQVLAQGLKLPDGQVPTEGSWQDGHYRNVVNTSYKYTGFAVAQYTYANSPYPCTYGQTFTGSGNTSNLLYTKDQPFTLNKTLESAAMTVADYKALLKDFIDEAKKDSPEMIAAKKTLADAQAELATAKAELEEAIKNQKTSVSPVIVGTSYTFQEGTTRKAVSSNQGYAISGTNQAVDAGSYTVMLSLNEGYIWSDGTSDPKTIAWEINRAKKDLSLNDVAFIGATVKGDKKRVSLPASGWSRITAVSSNPSVAEVTVTGSGATTALEITALAKGTSTITVTAAAGNYQEACATFQVTVPDLSTPKIELNRSNLNLTGYEKEFLYTGEDITPIVQVGYVVDEVYHSLTKDVDYTITYKNNREIGTASVTVTGIGNYTGSFTGEFRICRATMSDSRSGISYIYPESFFAFDGKPHTLNLIVLYNGTTLVENRDYTVSYVNNVNPGRGSVTIRGIGDYCGSAQFPIYIYDNSGTNDSNNKPGSGNQGSGSATGGTEQETPGVSHGGSIKPSTPGSITAPVVSPALPKAQSLSVSKLSKSYAPSKLTAKGKLAKAQSFTVKATGAVGKVVYKKLSGSKYVAVNSSGKVTVKKGTPKGTYSIKVRVSAGATGSYKASSIVKTVKVVVGDQTVKLGKSSISVKQAKVKKKTQTLKVAVKTSAGKINSAKNVSTDKAAKKFSVKKASSKQVTVKVPKGTKKGTYLLKVQIKAPKAAKCAAVTKTVSLKVVVK